MQVKIKKLHPDAKIPAYATSGAACFDLCALNKVMSSTGRAVIETGLAFEIPEGFAMIIKPRSGLAFQHGIHAFSGTIDSDYRGEVKVLLVQENVENDDYINILPGERIAQAMIVPVPQVEFVEVSDLSSTQRGSGGFGSTGS